MALFIKSITEWLSIDAFMDWLRDMRREQLNRQQARRTMNELSSLTDRELDDIGISRGDIRWVSEGRF